MQTNGTSNAPSKADIKAQLKTAAVKESVIEHQMIHADKDIGENGVDAMKISDIIEQLKEQIERDFRQSVDDVQLFTAKHYNAQDENMQRLNRLREQITSLETQLRDAEAELAELKEEKRRVLREKDSIIDNQKREMKEMAYQFSDMLMKTLISITEDFDDKAVDLSRTETSGLPGKDRLKEFNLDRIRV